MKLNRIVGLWPPFGEGVSVVDGVTPWVVDEATYFTPGAVESAAFMAGAVEANAFRPGAEEANVISA
jgi:hypothetical protein